MAESLEWRPIPGWPRYEVSENGDIRQIGRSWRGGFVGERKPYVTSGGYLYIALRDRGRKKVMAVHRLVAFAFLGPAPSPTHQIAHHDGDRLNNHRTNLRWATRSENESDKLRHGRSNRGERQGRSRLCEQDVRRIRERIAAGDHQKDIAADLGIGRTTISSIAIGRSWAWLR